MVRLVLMVNLAHFLGTYELNSHNKRLEKFNIENFPPPVLPASMKRQKWKYPMSNPPRPQTFSSDLCHSPILYDNDMTTSTSFSNMLQRYYILILNCMTHNQKYNLEMYTFTLYTLRVNLDS